MEKIGYITPNGIEILVNDDVPDSEVWLQAPLPEGGKVQYRFSLTDHRMTIVRKSGQSFLEDVHDTLDSITELLEQGRTGHATTQIGMLQKAISDFRRGIDVGAA